ncbi:MAG: endopeptidase La [Clostridia bacterium]|nr:endopeptidase La [Clostridia bacterium]
MQVIPVRGRAILPDTTLYIHHTEAMLNDDKAPEGGEQVLLVPIKDASEEAQKDLETIQSFLFPMGVLAVSAESMFQDFLAFSTDTRMIWSDLRMEDGVLQADVTPIEDTEPMDPFDAGMRYARLFDSYASFLEELPAGPIIKAHILPKLRSVTDLFAMMSIWLNWGEEDIEQLLGEDSAMARTDKMESMLRESLASLQLSHDGAMERETENVRYYRENAIRKQIAFLEKQLDEMHPDAISDIRMFEKRLEKAKMNDAARKEANRVLGRLKQENEHSPEYGLLTDYLDFITSLDWEEAPFAPIDLEKAESILDRDHYGLKEAKRRVIEQIAVINLTKHVSGSILLFVGSPGTGKTSIGRSVAEAMGREYVRVSLGGVRDEADIRGHRRTYIGAMPGRIMDAIHKCGNNHPVMVLDEVDKLCASAQGDPASALLEVLDPEQNGTFTDHYMNVPYDLSHVFFICTANTTSSIPEPLLNRMEVIRFPGYTAVEKREIGERHLLPKALEAVGLTKKELQLESGVMDQIISSYTAEAGVRGLRKQLDALCRQAAVRSWKQQGKRLRVTKKNLASFLEGHPIHHVTVPESQRAGVVTGLAWTAAGGDILFIETALTEGNEVLELTGQLGDVMKESAHIALSLVRMLFPEKNTRLKKHNLHIHVPSGAVPKDGPSAGITLTTALASLLTEKSVDPSLAMTGEISLHGRVTAIGGLPEKLMAALRAGVKTVLIPKENVEDLEDVPAEVREALTIHPVETIEEVLRFAGILEK